MKKTKLFIILIVCTMLFCGCDSKSYQTMLDASPERQAGTYWVNKEKSFVFYTDNAYKQHGFICVDSDVTEVEIYMVARGGFINVHCNGDESRIIEKWNFAVVTDDEFNVTVKETTFFNIGDQLSFHKVSQQEYESILESIGAINSN